MFVGVRLDSFDYSNDTVRSGDETLYAYSDTMYNGNIGFVYDLSQGMNIYANYSTATNINGGESDLGASCGYGGICGDVDQAKVANPERVENIELGTKMMFLEFLPLEYKGK